MKPRLFLLMIVVSCAWISIPAAEDPIDPDWTEAGNAMKIRAWSLAARHFTAYRQNHPNSAEAWMLEGYCRWNDGQFAQAVSMFEEALRLDPHRSEALYFLAEYDRRNGEFERAISRLELIDPVPAEISFSYHHLLGVLLIQNGQDPERAIDHLERIESLDSPSLLLLALARLRAGRPAQADPLLRDLCPAEEGASLAEAWIGCLDLDYCGELLDQRLEILQTLVARGDAADDLVVEAARVHLRHRRCGDPGLLSMLDAVAQRRDAACRVRFVRGLLQACDARMNDSACEDFRLAAACLASNVEDDWPDLSGPLVDPLTGAWLDVTELDGQLESFTVRHCNGD